MKKVLFYSPDFSMCYSLMMYLQDKYRITTTTDFELMSRLAMNQTFDLIILDAELSGAVTDICKVVSERLPKTPVILTYVFNNRSTELETEIRNYVSSIFYKPFNLHEVTDKLESLIEA